MPTPYEAALVFRRALLRRERDAEIILFRAYSGIQAAIERRLTEITDQLIKASESGSKPRQSWLYEQSRLQDLKRHLEIELRKYAHLASSVIASNQAAILQLAADDALSTIAAGLSPSLQIALNQLPVGAIQSLVGRLSDGSPLSEYLQKHARQYANHAASILRDGLAFGRNPKAIARELIKTTAMPRNRAIAIARDATLGAYRDATLDIYRENQDIVQGWVWLADLGPRTCGMCIAMHGSFHSLSEQFFSHSMCRCTTIPAIEPRSTIQSGVTWFNRQPAEVKRDILGSEAAYRAYQAGEVKLPDFIGKTDHPRWGEGRYQKSLKQVLGATRAKEFYATH